MHQQIVLLYVWHLFCHKSWNCGWVSDRNHDHTLSSFCFAITDPSQKVKVQTDRSHLHQILCRALYSFTLGALGMSRLGCCPPLFFHPHPIPVFFLNYQL